MSDIEKLFLAAYPLWPKALLEKFSSLLSLEVARFNPDVNQDIIKIHNKLLIEESVQVFPGINNTSYMLNPSNPSKMSKMYYDLVPVTWLNMKPLDPNLEAWFLDMVRSVPFVGERQLFSGEIIYDNRLYSGISKRFVTNYKKTSEFTTINPSTFMPIPVEIVNHEIFIVMQGSLMPYAGAYTVLAMVENGVSIDIDKRLLTEFSTFLSAYNKYSGEIAAGKSLQTEINRQTITDFTNSINEKLTSRKNDLNDMKIQLSYAAKNETASAKRDMQSLLLAGQTLMMQLNEKLK